MLLKIILEIEGYVFFFVNRCFEKLFNFDWNCGSLEWWVLIWRLVEEEWCRSRGNLYLVW